LVNTFFLVYPLALTAGVIFCVVRMSAAYGDLQAHIISIRTILSQGSLVWNQLQHASRAGEEKSLLSSQLSSTVAQLGTLLQETGDILPRIQDRFTTLRSMMLFFIPATSLVCRRHHLYFLFYMVLMSSEHTLQAEYRYRKLMYLVPRVENFI
jgi:hypothetical protein